MLHSRGGRVETSLLLICGLWHTLDQWTRVLMPFSLWTLQPQAGPFQMLIINAIAALFLFLGTFIMAQMVEAYGLRRSAIVATAVTGIYQILVYKVRSYWLFSILQTLLVANHIPMIIDAAVVSLLGGEGGDERRRSQFLNRLTIPMSIGMAAGPYMALQVLFHFTSSLEISQTMCGVVQLLVLLPIIIFCLPNDSTDHTMRMPTLSSYKEILDNARSKWCLVLLMMVVGPYCAYDQVIRISLSASVINQPHQLTQLFVILGGTAVFVNLWLLPILKSHLRPQQILTGSFVLLAVSYLTLSHITTYSSLLLGMPLQVIGVSICLGELSSQVLSTAGKHTSGKAAALIRMSHQLATIMTPLVTGFYVDPDETSLLCYLSAAISLLAIPVVHRYGAFMKTSRDSLPMLNKLD